MSTGLEFLLLGSALQAAGAVLQKQRVATCVPDVSIAQVTRRLSAFFGPLLRDPYWLLGGVLTLTGAIAGLQALAAMDLSVLKALGRLETLFVILAGVVLLGERLCRGESAGVLLLLAGSVLLTLRGGEPSGSAASRETYLVLVAGATGLLALLALARRSRVLEDRPELFLAAAAGILFGAGDTLTKGATDVVRASASGSGFSVVDAASIGGLFGTPELGVAIAAYLGGLILTQAAFSVGRISVIGPVMAIGNLLLPIAFGMAVLDEDVTSDRLAGIAAMALGTVLLARGRDARDGSRNERAAMRPSGPKAPRLRTCMERGASMGIHPDVGDPAPDFTLPSTDDDFRLYQRLDEGAVLLVFYPKDDTLVCTRQLCNYRDNLSEFNALQVEVVGINHDAVATHERFAARYRLPFTLCSDGDRKVSRVYGALPYLWNARRALVLVGEDRRVWWRHTELRLFRRDAEELLDVIREQRAVR